MTDSAVDAQFVGAGKTKGIEIWRIKDFKVEKVARAQYGQFYEGDSYIVLKTFDVSDDDDDDKLYHNVHFWMGLASTQDEMGTAAIKTVELDTLLGGGPVQYREVQNHESSAFTSCFRGGISYLTGGYDSGFFDVDSLVHEPRLLQCKGKRNVRATQVPLKVESLNKGDVFILDAGDKILVWTPPKSGRLERIKGIQQATNIRDHIHSGRGEIQILDDNWDSSNAFWSHFGGLDAVGKVKTAVEGGKDEGFWLKEKGVVQLHRISDASGKMVITEVARGELKYSMLDAKDAFVLDAGSGGLFVWIGKQCTMDERRKAMKYGEEYIVKMKKPKYMQVKRVLGGAESNLFMQWFKVETGAKAKKIERRLYQVSDESGTMEIDQIDNFTQDELDGDDVVLLDVGDKIFVWIGEGANAREKTAAIKTAEKYKSLDSLPRSGDTPIVKVEQDKESDEFKAHFPTWDGKSFASRTVQNIKKAMLKSTDIFF